MGARDGKTTDAANGRCLKTDRSPWRQIAGIDNYGSHYGS
jgi:monomeric isocitrate dehydrogenase